MYSSVDRPPGGCGACKTKRLKCGQERPGCVRCVRRGISCPGYLQKLKWSTKHEILGDRRRGFSDGRGKRKADIATQALRPVLEDNQPTPPVEIINPIAVDDVTGLLGQDDQLDLLPFWSDGNDETPSIYWPFDSTIQSGNGGSPGHDIDFGVYPTSSEHLAWLTESTQTQFQQQAVDHAPLDLESSTMKGYMMPIHQKDACPLIRPGEIGLADAVSQEPTIGTMAQAAVSPDTSQLILTRRSNVATETSNALTIDKPITDDSSVLVAYYFKDTAQIFSCYDGNLNPFRKTISTLWAASPLIYHSLSSMAAASLDHIFPQYRSMGLHHRKEAISLIEQASVVDETTLLAMLMLGGTASWHNPRDIGTHFLNLLVKHLHHMKSNGHFKQDATNYRFFQEAAMYWEMLLAYVVDSPELDKSGGSAVIDEQVSSRKVPHPWTGVARDTQYLVQEVGRLVRQQRKRAQLHRFMSHAHVRELRRAMERAEDLEGRLLTISLSTSRDGDVINPEDAQIPLWHLFTIGDVYRCAGLIQLYRVFPDLLHAKMTLDSGILTLHHENTMSSINVGVHSAVDDVPETSVSSLANRWLCAYTVKTVELLRTIPLESGTKDFQPFLLVALCSELRIQPEPFHTQAVEDEAAGIGNMRMGECGTVSKSIRSPSAGSLPVIRARGLTLSRLNSYLHMLPPRPIHICIDIVKASWERIDEATMRCASARKTNESVEPEAVDVYWLDVMMEHGWETTLA
ncbi:hypothetical protein H2200_001402 [Cladophialophora chaetospira]|uniref:Zn(2)-C6 fungal-type domain-containing protein n=1 Tax=Cladophialophora chaetospira TaxID=386627 RepID=A0AA38XKT4_9EURO|nr:hypothetical protein H2200_001402 [Cladophialophora chaetospira]